MRVRKVWKKVFHDCLTMYITCVKEQYQSKQEIALKGKV